MVRSVEDNFQWSLSATYGPLRDAGLLVEMQFGINHQKPRLHGIVHGVGEATSMLSDYRRRGSCVSVFLGLCWSFHALF